MYKEKCSLYYRTRSFGSNSHHLKGDVMGLIVWSLVHLEERFKDELRKEFTDVTFYFPRSLNEANGKLAEVDTIITYGEDLDEDHIKKANNLKWIMVFTSGIDRLPKEIIKEKEIIVTNVKGIHKVPMAEYALLMMLQTAKLNKVLIEDERNKLWRRMNLLTEIDEISSKTLFIVGAGQIGQEIARLAKAFQMKTVGFNRSGNHVDEFDECYPIQSLLKGLHQADFIISILPGTDATQHFWRKSHFMRMKPSAVFINIGRGKTVKEEDLLFVMKDKEIKHAVLDVFEQEPLEPKHPFWEMENITITPHIAGVSNRYHERALEIFQHNLRNKLRGSSDMINLVDLEKGY